MRLIKNYSLLKSSSTKGMTILEVIVVVAILGILAAIAAPSWLAFANRQRANRATDQVLQSIRSAQADAKRTRRTRTLKFEFDENTNTSYINSNGISSKIGEGDLDGMVALEVLESTTDDDNNPQWTKLENSISFTSTGGIADVNLPIYINVRIPDKDGVKKCVIIRSLLGATRTGSNEECAVPS
ncbi:MAG: type II secretion system protein [Cyanobacteria bacterium P01_F01_bin.150]